MGRISVPRMCKKVPMTISVDRTLKQHIKYKAKELGTDVSKFITSCVQHKIFSEVEYAKFMMTQKAYEFNYWKYEYEQALIRKKNKIINNDGDLTIFIEENDTNNGK